MNVLVVPYLYFKDFALSSGVVVQSDLISTLITQGVNVTVLLPEKKFGGWEYEFKDYFKDDPRLTHVTVPMVKNQLLWAGVMQEKMAKMLTPVRSPLMFDVILNGNPPTALSWGRLLCEVGFAGDLHIPIVNYYDVLTIPEEQAYRGGYSKCYAGRLQALEVMVATQHKTVLTLPYDYDYLRKSAIKFLSPANTKKLRDNVIHIPLPVKPPELRLREYSGGEFRIFIAQGFGTAAEDARGGANQHECYVNAIAALRVMGYPLKLVLCTASDITTDWAQAQFKKLGDGLELHHKATRGEVYNLLDTAHLAINLQGYNSLYLSALEQIMSGVPLLFKKTRWSGGVIDIDNILEITSFKEDEVAYHLKRLLKNYTPYAERAYSLAQRTIKKHAPSVVGKTLVNVLRGENTPINPTKYKRYHSVFSGATIEGLSFQEAEKELLKRTESGKWGRMPRTWVLKMLREYGYTLVGAGEKDNLPNYTVERKDTQ